MVFLLYFKNNVGVYIKIKKLKFVKCKAQFNIVKLEVLRKI